VPFSCLRAIFCVRLLRRAVGLLVATVVVIAAGSSSLKTAECVGAAEFCRRLGIGADVKPSTRARRKATRARPYTRTRKRRMRQARPRRIKPAFSEVRSSKKIELPPQRPVARSHVEIPVSEPKVVDLPPEDKNRMASLAIHGILRRELHRAGRERLAVLEIPSDETSNKVSFNGHSTTDIPTHHLTMQVKNNSAPFPSGLVWMLVPLAGILTVGVMRPIMRTLGIVA
jgi:hypothetical protein